MKIGDIYGGTFIKCLKVILFPEMLCDILVHYDHFGCEHHLESVIKRKTNDILIELVLLLKLE